MTKKEIELIAGSDLLVDLILYLQILNKDPGQVNVNHLASEKRDVLNVFQLELEKLKAELRTEEV